MIYEMEYKIFHNKASNKLHMYRREAKKKKKKKKTPNCFPFMPSWFPAMSFLFLASVVRRRHFIDGGDGGINTLNTMGTQDMGSPDVPTGPTRLEIADVLESLAGQLAMSFLRIGGLFLGNSSQ